MNTLHTLWSYLASLFRRPRTAHPAQPKVGDTVTTDILITHTETRIGSFMHQDIASINRVFMESGASHGVYYEGKSRWEDGKCVWSERPPVAYYLPVEVQGLPNWVGVTGMACREPLLITGCPVISEMTHTDSWMKPSSVRVTKRTYDGIPSFPPPPRDNLLT